MAPLFNSIEAASLEHSFPKAIEMVRESLGKEYLSEDNYEHMDEAASNWATCNEYSRTQILLNYVLSEVKAVITNE